MLGIGTLAKKVFGTPNDRKIKATRPIIDKINALRATNTAVALQPPGERQLQQDHWSKPWFLYLRDLKQFPI